MCTPLGFCQILTESHSGARNGISLWGMDRAGIQKSPEKWMLRYEAGKKKKASMSCLVFVGDSIGASKEKCPATRADRRPGNQVQKPVLGKRDLCDL